jgi:hypothetical protein
MNDSKKTEGCPQQSIDEASLVPGESLLPADPNTAVQLVVVYNLQEGCGLESLVCKARSQTLKTGDASDELVTIANTAAQMLTDDHQISRVYTSIVSNMLHVPTELREKPN